MNSHIFEAQFGHVSRIPFASSKLAYPSDNVTTPSSTKLALLYEQSKPLGQLEAAETLHSALSPYV